MPSISDMLAELSATVSELENIDEEHIDKTALRKLNTAADEVLDAAQESQACVDDDDVDGSDEADDAA